VIRVELEPTFEAFRAHARALLARGVRPVDVLWDDARTGQGGLFDAGAGAAGGLPGSAITSPDASTPPPRPPPAVPRAFVELARRAIHHRDPNRFALTYRVLYRLVNGERELLQRVTDPDVLRLHALAREVDRCVHHLHAFVRFRRLVDARGEHYAAFYRPEHPVLPLAAAFFAGRSPGLRWAILTPEQSVWCDGAQPCYGAGVARDPLPATDGQAEVMFGAYYAAVFNPARVNPRLLRRKLPARHWPTLLESSLLHELVRGASPRVQRMHEGEPGASRQFLPAARDLPALRSAAAGCTACPLFARATQTVFGEGDAGARIMLVGEQPGDEEDLAGRPFTGPAGRVLDAALQAAGLARAELYLTNAVKHFKWVPRGKRRLHSRPSRAEVHACAGWLRAEIAAIRPQVIVCLGATAAHALLGRKVAVERERGATHTTRWAPHALVTFHPAAVLRAADQAERDRVQHALTADLRRAAELDAGAVVTGSPA
jgi:DNA polymerase